MYQLPYKQAMDNVDHTRALQDDAHFDCYLFMKHWLFGHEAVRNLPVRFKKQLTQRMLKAQVASERHHKAVDILCKHSR